MPQCLQEKYPVLGPHKSCLETRPLLLSITGLPLSAPQRKPVSKSKPSASERRLEKSEFNCIQLDIVALVQKDGSDNVTAFSTPIESLTLNNLHQYQSIGQIRGALADYIVSKKTKTYVTSDDKVNFWCAFCSLCNV